jgi:hypothetical protein
VNGDRTPRASLQITLLRDEDFAVLMDMPSGPAAFGVFCALLMTARERHQEGRATRLDGTDSIQLEDRLNHVCRLAHISRNQLDSCLAALKQATGETGGEPWMTLVDGKLVIRNFYRYNVSDKHGGRRPGSGRKPENQVNQDDSNRNQIDSPTSSSTSTSSFTSTPTAVVDPVEVRRVVDKADRLYGTDGGKVSGWVRRACETWSPSWIDRVIDLAAANGTRRPESYMTSILQAWAADGGPPPLASGPRLAPAAPNRGASGWDKPISRAPRAS